MSFEVAVIAGGPSAEAAVSQRSAAAVQKGLVAAGHRVTPLALDSELPRALASQRFDAVFPVTHGPLGEDGCLQGLLEVLGLPYVGSGVLASALAMSKPHAKAHFRAAELPVARERTLHAGHRELDLEREAALIRRELGRAVIVKPASGGSAIGVGRITEDASDAEFARAVEAAFAVDPCVLVEAFMPGLEVTCGVLETDPDGASSPVPLPPTLIRSKAADWYDFTSRYATGGSEHECPAPFDRALIERIQSVAVGAFRALGARDLARMDFVVNPERGALILLEANSLPGMTATSLFPEAASIAGRSFPELCDLLVRRAASRKRAPAPAVVPMPD
jgi:D-alanine-D-alanine ligase